MENKTDDFRGLIYNPTLESEVVMLFSLLIPHLLDSFAIEEGDRGAFPDCLALRNGQKVGIEFELYANNFFDHKHDTRCPLEQKREILQFFALFFTNQHSFPSSL